MVNKMEVAIIGGYDGTPFQDYISDWTVAIVRHFQCKNIMSKSKKADWTRVVSGIIHTASRCEYSFQSCRLSAPVGVSVGCQVDLNTSSIAQSVATSTSESPSPFGRSTSSRQSTIAQSNCSSESSADTDSPSVKVPKLSKVDLDNIRERYEKLDQRKMWRLSTGTVVEDKIKEVAMTFEYEHPCHSLILDVTDLCWADVFEANELSEIRGFNAVEMPVASLEVESFFEQLRDLDSASLYTKVHSGFYPVESDSSWIQRSYLDTFRLLASDFFRSKSQTEGNMLKRVWANLDSCFDFNSIDCVSGEKCSQASADASNNDRCPSAFGRQSSGRKMDYLFYTTGYEVGCGECSLVAGNKTTKELLDAKYKMPKVMRDMANSVFKTHVGLCHDFCIAGYYIGGDALQLLTLDFPAGYVARLDGFGPVVYPKNENQMDLLPRLLKLILSGRSLMENAKIKIDNCKQFAPVSRLDEANNSIVPSFVHTPPLSDKKKRRKSNM